MSNIERLLENRRYTNADRRRIARVQQKIEEAMLLVEAAPNESDRARYLGSVQRLERRKRHELQLPLTSALWALAVVPIVLTQALLARSGEADLGWAASSALLLTVVCLRVLLLVRWRRKVRRSV